VLTGQPVRLFNVHFVIGTDGETLQTGTGGEAVDHRRAGQRKSVHRRFGQRESDMEKTRYGFQVRVSTPFEAARERVESALKAEGFGVLTTIDVRKTLEEKLARQFRPYVILGACNPTLADKALQADLDVGLLLPCNVVVYGNEDGSSTVAAMSPVTILRAAGVDPTVREVAQEAEQRLTRVLETLEGTS
jgi:uncharacterized protein (DUF302 family)